MSDERLNASSDELAAALRSLFKGWSIEVTPRELRNDPDVLVRALRPGTSVYLTSLPGVPFAETIDAAHICVDHGMRPVAHVAARDLASRSEFDSYLEELTGVGCRDILVIGGSSKRPAGTISESIQLLKSGMIGRHGVETVGVAGHPEGTPDISPAAVSAALRAKNDLAADQGIQMYLLTQFVFDGAPVVSWAARIEAEGITLPVKVGLPGLSTPARLLRFGLSCGVGASLAVLRKQAGGVLKLATRAEYHPDRTVLTLADAVRRGAAGSVAGVHFFPFGAVEPTARWAGAVENGRFRCVGTTLELVDET